MTKEEAGKLIIDKSQVKYGNAGTYTVADLKEQFGVMWVGIYDERPNNDHVDYIQAGNLELVETVVCA